MSDNTGTRIKYNAVPSLRVGGHVVRLPMISLECFIVTVALWPWGDSASNRNEYHEYFLGVKAAGA